MVRGGLILGGLGHPALVSANGRLVESAVKRTGKPRLMWRGLPPVFSLCLVVCNGGRYQTAPFVSPDQAIPHRQGSLWRTEKRALGAMWESSHRAETPRPVGIRKISRALAPLPHEG